MTSAAAFEPSRIDEQPLAEFAAAVLTACGLAPAAAATVAAVLVAADLRGHPAHGVATLGTGYVARLRGGTMNPAPAFAVLRETPASLALDADNGPGPLAALHAIDVLCAKAAPLGAAFGTVRNANDFGIASAYVMRAAERGLIAVAATNAPRVAAPTFGREPLLGANPLAVAVPAGAEPAFVFDAATTTVQRAALHERARRGAALEPGWAVDASGRETCDPAAGLAGALLPLGGYGVETSGHKGYGLGLLADILCGVLGGGAFGPDLPLPDDPPQPGRLAHFFAVFRVDGFRDPAAFGADMDAELRAWKGAPRSPGADRIHAAGEIEAERARERRAHGIPIATEVAAELLALGAALGVPGPSFRPHEGRH